MANIAIIGAAEHSERTGRLWLYLEERGHKVLLAADTVEEAHRAMSRLEASNTRLDAVFIADMPSSDSTQATERRLAGEFKVMPGNPKIISLAEKEDRFAGGGLTWYNRFAGVSDSETAQCAMEKSLRVDSTELRERMAHA
jgi:hypothetical protein